RPHATRRKAGQQRHQYTSTVKLPSVSVPLSLRVFTRTPFVTANATGARHCASEFIVTVGASTEVGNVPAAHEIVVSPEPLSVTVKLASSGPVGIATNCEIDGVPPENVTENAAAGTTPASRGICFAH